MCGAGAVPHCVNVPEGLMWEGSWMCRRWVGGCAGRGSDPPHWAACLASQKSQGFPKASQELWLCRQSGFRCGRIYFDFQIRCGKERLEFWYPLQRSTWGFESTQPAAAWCPPPTPAPPRRPSLPLLLKSGMSLRTPLFYVYKML